MELKGIIAIIVFVVVAGIIVWRNWPSSKAGKKTTKDKKSE
ncbi:MAG: hypothetical protein Q8O16_01275 [Dehalococcoidia bacterium]|nr:hypothetical protein [Dehalococcoidia bacterium]